MPFSQPFFRQPLSLYRNSFSDLLRTKGFPIVVRVCMSPVLFFGFLFVPWRVYRVSHNYFNITPCCYTPFLPPCPIPFSLLFYCFVVQKETWPFHFFATSLRLSPCLSDSLLSFCFPSQSHAFAPWVFVDLFREGNRFWRARVEETTEGRNRRKLRPFWNFKSNLLMPIKEIFFNLKNKKYGFPTSDEINCPIQSMCSSRD